MVINGETKWVYLLDELLEINDFGLYSQGIVEMITREITKKSYRETAKTISEDTDNLHKFDFSVEIWYNYINAMNA